MEFIEKVFFAYIIARNIGMYRKMASVIFKAHYHTLLQSVECFNARIMCALRANFCNAITMFQLMLAISTMDT